MSNLNLRKEKFVVPLFKAWYYIKQKLTILSNLENLDVIYLNYNDNCATNTEISLLSDNDNDLFNIIKHQLENTSIYLYNHEHNTNNFYCQMEELSNNKFIITFCVPKDWDINNRQITDPIINNFNNNLVPSNIATRNKIIIAIKQIIHNFSDSNVWQFTFELVE